MELLRVLPSGSCTRGGGCGQVCPCVNQAQPCYCEERAGYSHISYDCPLTIDTNIEYELKGLESEIEDKTNGQQPVQNTLLIDYRACCMPVGYVQATEPQKTYWMNSHSQEVSTPVQPTNPDLYQMIGRYPNRCVNVIYWATIYCPV